MTPIGLNPVMAATATMVIFFVRVITFPVYIHLPVR